MDKSLWLRAKRLCVPKLAFNAKHTQAQREERNCFTAECKWKYIHVYSHADKGTKSHSRSPVVHGVMKWRHCEYLACSSKRGWMLTQLGWSRMAMLYSPLTFINCWCYFFVTGTGKLVKFPLQICLIYYNVPIQLKQLIKVKFQFLLKLFQLIPILVLGVKAIQLSKQTIGKPPFLLWYHRMLKNCFPLYIFANKLCYLAVRISFLFTSSVLLENFQRWHGFILQ